MNSVFFEHTEYCLFVCVFSYKIYFALRFSALYAFRLFHVLYKDDGLSMLLLLLL